MTFKATFCYRVITPESAEVGESAEHGWILPGGWRFPLKDSYGYHPEVLEEARANKFTLTDLREVVGYAERRGICVDDDGVLASIDPRHDYTTGEDTYYTLHIEGVTPSTYRRIVRLITGEA